MFMFVGDGLLDLLVLGLDPRVVDVAVRVQFSNRMEPKLLLTMVDEPSSAEVSANGQHFLPHTGGRELTEATRGREGSKHRE